MRTYEEWRVAGTIQGEPYEFTWSPMRNPHLGNPEAGARGFLALHALHGIDMDLTLSRRTVTESDWEAVDGN